MNAHTPIAVTLLLTSTLAAAAPLRWAAQNDILSLDPHAANHGTTTTLTGYAYESLVRYTEKFEIEPALATKWTQVSPTQIRFELRRGVKFHDGQAMTAEDVVYSMARIRHPASKMTVFATGIKDVRKVDDYTVDLLLDSPQPVLLRNLTYVRVLSKEWLVKNKCEKPQELKDKEETFCSRNANGTGRYKVVSWQPDQKLQFTQNAAWWDQPRGNVTELTYLPIKQDATRVAALLSGDVDLLTDLPPQDVAKLKADPRLKIIDGPENRTIFFFMDQGSDELRGSSVKGRNPFKDKRVRQALSLALDREAIKRSMMRGYSVPAGLMVAPGTAGWSADLDTATPVDLARAKALLAEAGYADGFEVPLRCPNDRYVNDEEICQAAVAMWSKIGVRAKLTTQPMSQFTPALQAFDLVFGLYGWGVNTFDAQYTLQDIVHTRTSGADGKGNYFRLSDPVVDGLVQQMRSETDPAKRLGQMQDALKRTRDEVLFIPLHHQVRPWAMKAGVSIPHAANDAPQIRLATVK
ncbi:ABC transporter substrate-binding protein [Roseateles sp. BYS87W]|uniref:ABC transporter substrate-binding protein n=1 Tax=Pelomonas baiyunensis TaxID=3299026 RepID=A0ABW7GV82_9BURK